MKKVSNRIEEHMTEYPAIASRDTTVSEAFLFMNEMGFRHLPVLEDGKVVGIVSDRDLRQAKFLADDEDIRVADVMTMEPYCAKVGTPLSEVAKKMADNKFGSTVILNDTGQVVGIFTVTDAVRLLSEILASENGPQARHWAIEKLLSGDILVSL